MISTVVGVKIKQIIKTVNPFVDEKQLCNADIKSIISVITYTDLMYLTH